MSTIARMSADELLRRPADGCRHELVRGELRNLSPAGGRHGEIALEIAASIHAFVRANSLGRTFAAETGFRIGSNPDTVRAPDFAFVRRDRSSRAGPTEGFIDGAPDLAVEVLSPSDSHGAVDERVEAWLAAGTAVVVIVDPAAQRVVARRRGAPSQRLERHESLTISELLPGWSMALTALFA